MTVQTVDTLGHAIDGALHWDAIEEHRALAQIEQRMFARVRDPVRLSRYLLLRPLGSGGTGVVYDGYDPELARRVAVKVLRAGRKNLESVARARARFVREAQSIARLSHSNVIAVHDVGTYAPEDLTREAREGLEHGLGDDVGVFIVMELVDGHDLSTWLERERHSWRDVLPVFIAAGQGLEAAHAAGIVHRDFKPGNVLVGEDGRVKVVDFGLALTYGGSVSDPPTGEHGTPPSVPSELASLSSSSTGDDDRHLDKLTRTGTLLGTPAYMAPEQHRGEPADQKADQFAFCASLYRGLYGRHAFAGRRVESLFASKIEGKVRPPPADSRVPAWLHRVVLRGLATHPSGRFGSMEELLRALRSDPAKRWRRWARWAAVPLTVGAVGYAGYLATRPGQVEITAAAAGQAVPGVRVYIDDEELPEGRGEVVAGLHRVRATAPGHQPAEGIVDVSRGGVHEVALELAHEQGTFDLELEPAGGRVLIDGVDYGSRLTNLRIDTGPHEILARHVGFVDQRLSWNAMPGQTRRGFVALRKALAWSRPASGTFLHTKWLGDIDGDGLDDLVARRFTTLTAYDPWHDRERWRIVLGLSPYYQTCDVDGDEVLDIVTIRASTDGAQLEAYTSTATSRRPSPRWVVPLPTEVGGEEIVPGEIGCVPQPGDAGDDLLVGLSSGLVMTVAGTDGRLRWSQTIADQLVATEVLNADSADPTAVVVGLDGVYAMDAATGRSRWTNLMPVAAREDNGTVSARWTKETTSVHNDARRWVLAADLGSHRDDLLLHVAGQGPAGAAVAALSGGNGQESWRVQTVGVTGFAAEQNLGDADGDGGLDVLVARPGKPGTVDLIVGRTGRTLWTRPRVRTAVLLSLGPSAMVVEVQDSRVTLVDGVTGAPVAEHELSRPPNSAMAVYDWDGDTRRDLVMGTGDGVVRAFDSRLRPLGTVPLQIPFTHIEAGRDANHDGFDDLLLQARGPAVMLGPKVRWQRRTLESIRATPVVADLDGDGLPELALFGTLARSNRLEILDARTGLVEASSAVGQTPIVIRPPAVVRADKGSDLLVVGNSVKRFSGRDASIMFTGAAVQGHAYASPLVLDLDGDGVDEVLVVSWEDPGVLYVLDAQTLELRWSRTLGEFGSFDAPSVVDVDNDGEVDLLISSLDGRVICLSRDGEPKWDTQTGGRLNHRPAVADLDGDGIVEILVAPQLDGDPMVVLRGTDGAEVDRWMGVATRRSPPLIRDVDRDGTPEVVTATETQGLVGLNGDGTVRWRYGFADLDGRQPAGTAPPILADLDRDGHDELVVGFEDGSLHVVDARDGTLVWRFGIGREEIEASPAVADVDGDGQLEVFVAGHDRQLLCLEHQPGGR